MFYKVELLKVYVTMITVPLEIIVNQK